ncbi:hypothetical protein P1X15_20225, partial [Runella sp. MFBS21]|nr:hypothetical protein [Runella sp. MFBS21]
MYCNYNVLVLLPPERYTPPFRYLFLFFCFGLLLLLSPPAMAQSVGKVWDKRFGGEDYEELQNLTATSDGGFVLGGSSYSGADGDKTETSRGGFDYWVVRIDKDGNKVWDKRFGGAGNDELHSLTATSDGGFVLGGSSYSGADGDKTETSRREVDFWVVKIDKDGNKIWDKRFGGIGNDYLQSLTATSDGDFVLGGYSSSDADGDKTEASRESYDYWVVRIDKDGNKIWDKRFGGIGNDYLQSLAATSNGGFVLGGYSDSDADGDKTEASRGSYDYWVVRIDKDGNKIWDKRFGGIGTDYLQSLTATSDGDFVLGGYSSSDADGDKTETSRGGLDYWVVRIDKDGNKIWDKRFGGANDESLHNLTVTSDGSLVLGGSSDSEADGDKTEVSRGRYDYWVVRIDKDGNKIWDKRFGGAGNDELHSLTVTSDGSLVLGGYSSSEADGDKTEVSRGRYDYWLVKIKECALTASITSGFSPNLCSGAALTLSGNSSGTTTPTYSWSSLPAGFSSEQQNPSFIVPSVTSPTNYTLTLTVTQEGCTATDTTQLTVSPLSVGGSVSSIQTICSGTSPDDIRLSSQTGNVVKWQKSTDEAFSNPVDIIGTSTTLTGTQIGALTADTWFRAVVQSGNCTTANSTPIKITVNTPPSGGSVNSPQTICSGTAPSDVNLSGQSGSVLKWQISSDAAFSNPSDIASTSTTLTSALIGNLTADTWFRAVVQSGVCATANSESVKITVNPTSQGGTVGNAQTICANSSPADVSLSSQVGSVVKWQKSSDAAFSNPSDIASTFTTLTSALIGNLTADTWFRAVVQSGVCATTNSESVKITVNPTSQGGTV